MNKLSVTQLNQFIRNVFEDEIVLQNIAVMGELSEFKISNNNTFFAIKDENSSINCVMFSRNEEIAVGTLIIAYGSVKFYAKTGKTSFAAHRMSVYGEGLIHQNFLNLKRKLGEEGLFNNPLVIPSNPSRVGIITSETGAVLHDFIEVVTKKNPLVSIFIYSVKVQGEESSNDIRLAISDINRLRPDIEVLVVARGGGSTGDLAAYNTEVVARAVASSHIPIISAVGHETDYTLCDLCASRRAGTPSIAGEMAVKSISEGTDKLSSLCARMTQLLEQKQANCTRRLDYGVDKLTSSADKKAAVSYQKVVSSAKSLVAFASVNYSRAARQLTSFASVMGKAIEQNYSANSVRLNSTIALLDKCSPLKIMDNGYSRITHMGRTVKSSEQLKINDELKIQLVDGKVMAKITSISKENGGNGI